MSEAAVEPATEPPHRACYVRISDPASWAAAVAALPVAGPLPARTVLVPTEAHAHILRCQLSSDAPGALAGTRLLTLPAVACAVLDAAGVAYRVGEEQRRPLRFRAWLRSNPALACYRTDELETPGWEAAFASTIEQLEEAALEPADLDRLATPRMADLASIWRALDDAAAGSWTLPRILKQAGLVLAAAPAVWPWAGPVLAVVTNTMPAVDAALVRVIPRATIGVVVARPLRRAAVVRMAARFGAAAAEIAGSCVAVPRRSTELGVLCEYLFAPPAQIAHAERRRSQGPDGSVTLEVHAGIDEEVDAAARWVVDEVFHHETPLQDIAILVPTPDPLAALLATRIAERSGPAAPTPVYLACGRPATSTAAGARLLAVANALVGFLPAAALIELVPRLRRGDDGHVSPGRARALVEALGARGGSAARPGDALQWRDRVAASPDPSAGGLAPAISAVVAVAADVIAGASLAALWAAVRAFVTDHVVMPRAIAEILASLDVAIGALAKDRVTSGVVGVEAMQLIAEQIAAARIRDGRFGEPAVYVGTVLEAAGLGFRAVRILGAAEGMFPRTLREDPVLPAEQRRRLPADAMPGDAEFAAAQLHAFDQVVRATGERLVISAPLTDAGGGEREPAALFVEIAAALGRPDAATGRAAGSFPTRRELERDAFGPARRAGGARRIAAPLTPACWLDRVAAGADDVPSEWTRAVVIDPGAIADRQAAMHGILGPARLTQLVPGLGATHPTSVARLRDLLSCPHRFLLAHVLGFRPREPGADPSRIDPRAYGLLVHGIAEQFARLHGVAFGARQGPLEAWCALAVELADRALDDLVARAPLAGREVVAAERRRLHRDVRRWIELDWAEGRARTLIDVERAFGAAGDPLAMPTSQGPLFLAGRIDRLDREGAWVLVRDLKTGRAPREPDRGDPDVAIDLQLAVYAVVAEHLAPTWGLPGDVAAAYVYTDRFAPRPERAFRADRHALRAKGRAWLDLARGLLLEGAYPQTPMASDCRRCAFARVCGDGRRDDLRGATGQLARYRELRA